MSSYIMDILEVAQMSTISNYLLDKEDKDTQSKQSKTTSELEYTSSNTTDSSGCLHFIWIAILTIVAFITLAIAFGMMLE